VAARDPRLNRHAERHDLPLIADRFSLGRVRTVAFLPSGLMNLNWRVEGTHATAAVKRLLDAKAVRHRRARELQAGLGQHLTQHVIAIQHELGTELDDGLPITGDEFLRPDPAAHPVACLQHDDLTAALG
jgi:hypothetical protein